jgi:hypothetical protein
MIWQPSEDVGEPGLRIDVVELCGRDERVDSSRPTTTFVRAGEGPVPAADRDGAQQQGGALYAATRCKSSMTFRRLA